MKINPIDAKVLLKKGMIYIAIEKKDAVLEYDKAIKGNPQDSMVDDSKGYSLLLFGRISGTIETLSESV